MSDAFRAAVVLVLAALAGGAGAEAASAGTASGRPATFTARAGEQNVLTVAEGTLGAVQFSDEGAPILAGLWCTPFPLGQAGCDPDGDPRDTDGGGVGVDLGDGDDRAFVRWVPGTQTHPGFIRVSGGGGDDRLESSTDAAALQFDGGDGDDTLLSGPAGSSTLRGGAGADLTIAGSACCHVTSYDEHDAAGVRVTLDATPNDGAPGERDDVRTLDVLGSRGPDVIVGNAGPNRLTGAGGADRLDGGAGDDEIDATLPVAASPGEADGRDRITCGTGHDRVQADPGDAVAQDCEIVTVGVGPDAELLLDAGTGRVSRTGLVKLAFSVPFAAAPVGPPASINTIRLVDAGGRGVSSTARFAIGDSARFARVRVRLHRATLRRLARSRSGRLTLIARRVSRNDPAQNAAAGYVRFSTRVTVRRAVARRGH